MEREKKKEAVKGQTTGKRASRQAARIPNYKKDISEKSDENEENVATTAPRIISNKKITRRLKVILSKVKKVDSELTSAKEAKSELTSTRQPRSLVLSRLGESDAAVITPENEYAAAPYHGEE